MAALVTKQSQLPMTRRVQRTFWHSNAIKLKYTQKKASKSSPAAVFSRSAGGRRFRRLLVYQAPATHVKQKQRKIIL